MRASRLISLLLVLQTKEQMTAEELAKELQVSVRTVYRDVEALNAAGVPIYGQAGPAGGYRLVEGYRTRLTGLSPAEAEALFLAGLPGPAAELGLTEVVAALDLKLKAALPEHLRGRAENSRQRFLIDAPGWYQDGDDSAHLGTVARAVWAQTEIRIRYSSWTQVSLRTVQPLGIVLKGGVWYLVATAPPPNGQIKTYRINQIQELEPLSAPFTRPEGFDLAGFWRAQVLAFRSSLHQGEALIRLAPRAMERLPDLMDPAVVQAAALGALQPDGWVQALIPIESPTHAETEFLKLGADVEVLHPPVLRERLAATARRLAAMYQDPGA